MCMAVCLSPLYTLRVCVIAGGRQGSEKSLVQAPGVRQAERLVYFEQASSELFKEMLMFLHIN